MLKIHNTKAFRQDFKRMVKAGKDMQKLRELVELLEQEKPLDDKYKNHPLLGVWKDYQECLDGLLLLSQDGNHKILWG